MAKVLIAEPLADAGVQLLAAHHEVDARASTSARLASSTPMWAARSRLTNGS